jgi:GTP-binding protein HflX
MKTIWGNPKGLKHHHLKRLENLYRRKVPPEFLITPELTRDLAQLSFEIQRQIGLLIDRGGKVAYVVVGDFQTIFLPELHEYRAFPGRLRGVRCIHTHLKNEGLTDDDLTDLSLLRLDAMAAVTINDEGWPHKVHWAHILPDKASRTPYQLREALKPHELSIDCLNLIQSLETEMGQIGYGRSSTAGGESALLVSITTQSRQTALDSLAELEELCRTAGIAVEDTVLQLRKQIDAHYLMGSGKLKELAIRALQLGVDLIIFDQNLSASQIRSITDQIALKVIDRTQLILDIFAQRARSREGKLQVELAQLNYMLPRLVTKNTAMSRLTGGIGGRGPGETKLEINRRRVRERIHHLQKLLEQVQRQRQQQRRRREQKGLPVISIIGYTNAGKSTLLNTLTHSQVLAESKLFATLDPSSKRLRFPRDQEVLITDTVGFIRDLPKDLMVAFRATLEELENADLLLHVVDISNPRHPEQIEAVEAILNDLELTHLPVVRALNKVDLLPEPLPAQMTERLNGTPISARDRSTLGPLIEKLSEVLQVQLSSAAQETP